MKIDFNDIPLQRLDNFKGGDMYMDTHMFVDDHCRIMRSTLVPGASIGMHTHTDSSEMIYILSGEGTVICDGVDEVIPAGCCHYCPKGSSHTLINHGEAPLDFFAVVPNQ